MDKKSDSKLISRRKFIKGLGVGVVGGAIIPDSITPQKKKHSDKKLVNKLIPITLEVNGDKIKAEVEPGTTLIELLRDDLKLTGTKIMCNQGECGSCTVLMDGKSIYSCHMLALDAQGSKIQTIEGLLDGEKLQPLQETFIKHDGLQCGFCTPGQILSAKALLLKIPSPTKDQVIKGMSGNLCRCGAYKNIISSVMAASKKTG